MMERWMIVSRLSRVQYGTGLQIKKSTLIVALQHYSRLMYVGSRYAGVPYFAVCLEKSSGYVAYVYLARDLFGYEIMKDGECVKSVDIPSQFTHHDILADISYEISKASRMGNLVEDKPKGGFVGWVRKIFTK
jgi:hypothetical protein